MLIREARTEDWDAVWPFFESIVRAGETFTYPLDLSREDAEGWWMVKAPSRTVVAVDDSGTVLGTAKMNRNHMGNGSHIASASYMVAPRTAAGAWAARSARTPSTGRGPRGTGRCSSTPWWRPTPAR